MLVRVLKGNEPDGSFILPEDIHITRREISALVMVANGLGNQDVVVGSIVYYFGKKSSK